MTRRVTVSIQRTAHAETRPIQHVRVNHGGADVFVPKKFLNRANIMTCGQELRSERMTERVTTRWLCNLRKANRVDMRPLRMPSEPTSHELISAKRAFPPNYLHESWLDYLYWDSEIEN